MYLVLTGDKYEEFLSKYGETPLSAFHAHAYDAANILFDAIEQIAVSEADGTLHIGRQALRDALYATKDFNGISGNPSCNEFGDCVAHEIILIAQIKNGEYLPLR